MADEQPADILHPGEVVSGDGAGIVGQAEAVNRALTHLDFLGVKGRDNRVFVVVNPFAIRADFVSLGQEMVCNGNWISGSPGKSGIAMVGSRCSSRIG